MRKHLLKYFTHVFKEDLSKDDFIKGKDINIEVRDDVSIKPHNVMTPACTPIHLRKAADTEVPCLWCA